MGVFLGPVGDDPQSVEVQRLGIRPGDVLVLRLDYELSSVAEANEIKARVAGVFGWPVPVLILERGVDIGVIGPDEAT
jgi:hypothetical protein